MTAGVFLVVAVLVAGCSLPGGGATSAPGTVTVTATLTAGPAPAVTVTARSAAPTTPTASTSAATNGGLSSSTQELMRACAVPEPPRREDLTAWVSWDEGLRRVYFRTGEAECLRGYYTEPPPQPTFTYDVRWFKQFGRGTDGLLTVEAVGTDRVSPAMFHSGTPGDNRAEADFAWDQTSQRWRVIRRVEHGSE